MTQVAMSFSNAGGESVLPQHSEAVHPVKPAAAMVVQTQVHPAPSPTPEHRPTHKESEAMVLQLNKALEAFDTHVSLSVDEKSKQRVIKVVDNQSGKVVRQIPSEQLLKISQRITELLGVIYDEKM